MPHLNRGLLSSTALTNVGLISAGLMLVSGSAMALPQNGQVVGGSSTITQVSPNQVDINQASQRSVINWQSFSIGGNQAVIFNQPNSSAVSVDRVVGVDPSNIAGRLSANGQVVLINPNGILFDKGAKVNVGGLVATTSDISNQNAMAGNYVFNKPSTSANATIVNNGTITARQGGLVALVAPSVVNNGVINARLGKVALASGNEWALDLYGDKLVSFVAPNDVVKPVNGGVGVTNNGKIYADAGTVQLTANDAKGLVDNAVNMNGVIVASSVSHQGGAIVLDGGSNGVKVTGTIDAVGTTGGAVSVTGSTVTLAGATVNASGENGGGTIAIGGDLHGAGTLAQADTVVVDSDSVLKADAIQQGNGGVISVWSDGDTTFAGTASAKGGFSFGNGGTVETSGHTLNFAQAVVDTEASNGTTGTWILDPYNLTINAQGAAAIDAGLQSSNVLVQTTNSGSTTAFGTQSTGEGDITVASAISWGSANSLTLSAYDNISVNAPITNSGTGNVILRADNTGNGTGAVAIASPVSTNGSISIYYDAPNYQAPTTYATAQASAAGGVTAYMLVNTQADLERINTALCPTTSALCGNYALGNNITLTGAYTQIGDVGHVFSGLFDGNGGIAQYTISGLDVTGTSYVGLFGDASGPIRNVTASGTVVADGNYIGGLVGFNAGLLTNDAFNGTVSAGTSSDNVGGLVGGNYLGTVTASSFAGLVTVGSGSADVGGIAGANTGLLENNMASGTIAVGYGNVYVGGYVGDNFGGAINSGSAGTVTGKVIGGSFSGTVSAGDVIYGIGGFAGDNTGAMTGGSFSGNVIVGSAGQYIGGFVGSNYGMVSGGVAAGSVVAGNSDHFIGGFAGYNGADTTTGEVGSLVEISSTANISVGTAAGGVGGLIGLNYAGTSTGGLYNGTIVAGNNSLDIGGVIGINTGSLLGGSTNDVIDVGNNVTSVGDIVGYNQGLVSDITAFSSITGGNNDIYLGGAVGINDAGGLITGVSVGGSISAGTGTTGVGGLVGYNGSDPVPGRGSFTAANATVTDSTSSVNITVSTGSFAIGSLIGANTVWTVGNSGTGTTYTGVYTNNTATGTLSVGAGTTWWHYPVGGDMNLAPFVDVPGTITLNITPTDTGKVYGQSDPTTYPFNVAGLYENDTTSEALAGDITRASGQNVGSYAYEVGSLTTNSNYTISIAPISFVITPASLVLAANNTGKVYGTTPTYTTSYSGLVNGDTSSVVTGITYTSAGTTSTAGVGTYSIAESGAAASNYTITYGANGTLTVTPASLVISTGNSTKTYGSTPSYTTTYAGLVAGDTTGVVSGLTISSTGATSTANVGTYGITDSGAVARNYTVTYGQNGSLSVTPASLTITTANSTKTYGSTPGYTTSYVGLVAGNTTGVVSGLTITSAGATSTAGVGTYGITNSGAVASNYTVTYGPNGSLTVTPASLLVSTGNATKTYGGTPSYTTTYAGLVAGDTTGVVSGLTVNSAGATSTANVGTYGITDSGAVASNYSITYGPNGSLTVNPASLTIITGNSTKTYGSTPGYTTSYVGLVAGNTTSVVSGLTVSSAGATSTANVGTYSITENGAVASNYSITYGPNGSLTVNPASLIITVGNTTKSYGTSPNYVTTYAGLAAGDTSSVVSGLTITSAGATTTATVGTYSISDSGAVANNYSITYGANGSLTVTPAAITITTGSSTKTYGSTPGFTTTYTGLINGDTTSVVSGLTVTSAGATSTAGVGTYAITDTGATASNYLISYGINGSLTVTPAPLTISTGNSTKTYGSSPSYTTTYAGLVAGDTTSVVNGLSVNSAGATSTANVGTYGITDSGAAASNYAITYGSNGSLTVNPAPLTITGVSTSKTYGSTPTYTSSYTGLVAGNTSSVVTGLTYSSAGTTSTAGVGTYTISEGGATASNYTITYGANGSLVVNPAPLTITGVNSTKTYGSSPTYSSSYTGLVAGDTSSVVGGLTYSSGGAPSNASVGTYVISEGGATASNYTITYGPNGSLVVNPAPLTVTTTGTKTYGSSPTYTESFTGLTGGDTSTVVTGLTPTSAGATSTAGVGTYTITSTGATASNYTITYGSGSSLVISPAPLTITANNASRSFGTTDPTFTATFQGLVAGDTSSVVNGLTITSNDTPVSLPGQYTITPTNGVATNYTITYQNGTLTVTGNPLGPIGPTGTITPVSTTPPSTTGTINTLASLNGLIDGSLGGLNLVNNNNQNACLRINADLRPPREEKPQPTGTSQDINERPVDCSAPLKFQDYPQ